jgi:hypothetical protein
MVSGHFSTTPRLTEGAVVGLLVEPHDKGSLHRDPAPELNCGDGQILEKAVAIPVAVAPATRALLIFITGLGLTRRSNKFPDHAAAERACGTGWIRY